MKPFRYFYDPLFLAACALYALNRWVLKPLSSAPFIHNWSQDLLLMPCALPPLLWLQSRFGLRARSDRPRWSEIALYLVVWSILFEVAGPWLYRHAIGDWRDVLAYAVSAAFAGWWWNRDSAPVLS